MLGTGNCPLWLEENGQGVDGLEQCDEGLSEICTGRRTSEWNLVMSDAACMLELEVLQFPIVLVLLIILPLYCLSLSKTTAILLQILDKLLNDGLQIIQSIPPLTVEPLVFPWA